MNEDASSDVEIDDSVMDVDGIVVGTTTGVDGGRVDAVEGDSIPTDAGVTTDVEPSVDIGRDDSKLRLTLSSSSSSVSDDSVGGGSRSVLGVRASCPSTDPGSGEGAADSDRESSGS